MPFAIFKFINDMLIGRAAPKLAERLAFKF